MFRRVFGLMALAVALTVAGHNASATAQDQPSSALQALIVQVVELNTWYRAVLIDREATRNPADLETIGRSVCEGLAVCRAGLWTEQWSTPNGLPVSASQLEAQEYAFGRNPEGEETSLWNCNRYPEFEATDACLPSVLQR